MSADKNIVNIREALLGAQLDSKVGIAIVCLAGNDDFALYAAELAPGKSVTAHYHSKGVEIYHVLEGAGIMHTGIAEDINRVRWNKPLKVKAGDCFNVEEREVHQLQNTGDKRLLVVFGCPNAHLNQDRFIVEGAAR
jgi:mannose-6-phosphate isomerase-like protein (cupin superfamily)